MNDPATLQGSNGPEPPPVGANGEDREHRAPPVNDEAEQALLGALLAFPKAWDLVADKLKPEHFADELHREIFAAIGALIDRNGKADAVTVRAALEGSPVLENGGQGYLAGLQNNYVTIVNVPDYAETIMDCALRRELIALSEDIADRATLGTQVDSPAAAQAAEHVERLYGLLGEGDAETGALRPVLEDVHETLRIAEEAWKARARGQAVGLTTGLPSLDKLIGALMPGDVVVLAGSTSMGKSSLAENIAWGASREGKRPAFFSREMSKGDIIRRELSRLAHVPVSRIRTGEVTDLEMQALIEAQNEIRELPLQIDESAGTVAAIHARARRLQRSQGLDLLIIDYVQLLDGPGGERRYDNRVQEITEVTRAVKTRLAGGLKVPVLLLSQLSRKVEERDDKRPHLSDLRESGSIEQDADVVLFVFRPEYYLSRDEPVQKGNETAEKFRERRFKWEGAIGKARGKAEIIVAKQRYGPTGTANVNFEGPRMRFWEEEPVEPLPEGEVLL